MFHHLGQPEDDHGRQAENFSRTEFKKNHTRAGILIGVFSVNMKFACGLLISPRYPQSLRESMGLGDISNVN